MDAAHCWGGAPSKNGAPRCVVRLGAALQALEQCATYRYPALRSAPQRSPRHACNAASDATAARSPRHARLAVLIGSCAAPRSGFPLRLSPAPARLVLGPPIL